jgi:hypothetical protein
MARVSPGVFRQPQCSNCRSRLPAAARLGVDPGDPTERRLAEAIPQQCSRNLSRSTAYDPILAKICRSVLVSVRLHQMALRPNAALETAIRSRVARIAVGPSTVRGNPRGTAEAARRSLRALSLKVFAARNPGAFAKALDQSTARVQADLPRGGQRWGVARKVLNIYLRDCVYSAHLRSVYGLGRCEAYCEVPLDSITARRLRQSDRGTRLPAWPGVRNLTPQISAEYQAVAAEIGRALKVRRTGKRSGFGRRRLQTTRRQPSRVSPLLSLEES